MKIPNSFETFLCFLAVLSSSASSEHDFRLLKLEIGKKRCDLKDVIIDDKAFLHLSLTASNDSGINFKNICVLNSYQSIRSISFKYSLFTFSWVTSHQMYVFIILENILVSEN